MRQKNVHGYPLTIPSLGLTLYPGEIIDHDAPLPGFEEVAASPEPNADLDAESPESTAEPPSEAAIEPSADASTPGTDPQEVTR